MLAGAAMVWGGSAAWIVLAGYENAVLLLAAAMGLIGLGMSAPILLLVGALAWANNPTTRFLAPDIAGASSYVPLAVAGVVLAEIGRAHV